MGTWFDGLAKRSAKVEESDAVGLTRRQVLARGAVVTGAAWTAPMLLSATPAWAVTSCPTGETSVMCSSTVSKCCPAGNTCIRGNGNAFICNPTIGGVCGNRGFGTNCDEGRATCNQACSSDRDPICGGPGATCSSGTQCQFGNCSVTGFCGGEGAACTGGGVNECNPGTCANGNVKTCCSTTVVGQAGICSALACPPPPLN